MERSEHEDDQTNDNQDVVEISDDEADVKEQPQLRRSTRVKTTPEYLSDCILLAEEECEWLLMSINDEPWDYSEARGMKVWIMACEDEIRSIEKNQTWTLVELPSGVKPIGLK